MKLRIEEEEWYPVYERYPVSDSEMVEKFTVVLDVDEETARRCGAVFDAFAAVQSEINALHTAELKRISPPRWVR